MKELSLKELQSFGLEILKSVHDFCISNDIRYSLAYGTLIGAIRHRGFIPWDDDIDIIMPRPDYERFCKEYKSKDFLVSCFETDPDCRISFARVYDNKRTVVKTMIPWNLKPGGVWIDVFPLDAIEDNTYDYEKRFQSLSRLFRLVQHERSALRKFSSVNSFYLSCKSLAIKFFFLDGLLLSHHIRLLIKRANSLRFGTTNKCGMLAYDSYGIKDCHKTSLFYSFSLVPFEQHEFMAVTGYDEYLNKIYGDYMKMPPENQRNPKQTYLHFYWLENEK